MLIDKIIRYSSAIRKEIIHQGKTPTIRKDTSMKLSKARRRAFALLGGVVLALTPVVVLATPANAAVYNCTTGYNANGWAYAKCLTAHNPATDRYRVAVLCRNVFWQSHTVYGDWKLVNSSGPSTVQGCPLFETYYGSPLGQQLVVVTSLKSTPRRP